jgi:hypothetical protein
MSVVRPLARRVAAGAAAVVALVAVAPSAPSGAAGMTTHTWMAVTAVDEVESPDLRALLLAHPDQVTAGAKFPDGGYVPGQIHGEEAHWQRFADAMVTIIRGKGCGDLTDPAGPCAAEIAHLMGIVAHGTGDEVWDWLFEPQSPDRGEYYTHPELPLQDLSGQETVMDLVAVGVHHRPDDPVPPLPSKPDLIAAFAAAGLPGVTEAQLDLGQAVFSLVHEAESQWAAQHLQGVLEAMPWMSSNLVTAPGGVQYAATAIAGQWEALWAQLLGDPVPTEVSITYPADGQRGIPASGWVRTYLPGSSPGRGGARTRIAASLTYSLPYRVPGGPGVVDQLPAGAMTLTERDSGTVLPSLSGFPRAVPYGADSGEHTIAFQPGVELQPCTWYRVDVTTSLLDARRKPVVPHSWEFRTGLDAAGTACPDDPPPADVLTALVTQAHLDLLGRQPDALEVATWVERLGDGAPRTDLAEALVGSAEHRGRLVDVLFALDVGRAPTARERATWASRLATRPGLNVRGQLLAEKVGDPVADPAGWVRSIYASVLGRSPSSVEVASWVGQLDAGRTPTWVGRTIAGGLEARQVLVRSLTEGLLDRAATDAEVARGARALHGPKDWRPFTVQLVAGDEYLAVASEA